MTRKGPSANIEPSEWSGYCRKAVEHATSAEAAARAGRYNSGCVLAVHAAINLADAVSIFVLGRKSTSEKHDDLVRLLSDKFEHRTDREALKHLGRILSAKGRVEYTGVPFRERDWADMWRHLTHFRAWTFSKLPPEAGTSMG